jgi:hypothetical protein
MARFNEVKLSDLYTAFVDADDWDEKIAELRELWQRQLPGLPLPDDDQFKRWLRPTYGDAEPLVYAMARGARRMRFNAWRDPLHATAWISSVSLARWNEKRHGQQRKAVA